MKYYFQLSLQCPGWKPHKLQARPDHGRGDNVVHKESAVVREEDALPVNPVVSISVIILVFLDDSLQKCSQCGLADGGQNQDHEEKVAKDFPHDPQILHRSSPVAETPVGVGHHHGQQG